MNTSTKSILAIMIITMATLTGTWIGCSSEWEPTQSAKSQTDPSTPVFESELAMEADECSSTTDSSLFTADLSRCAVEIFGVSLDTAAKSMTMTLNAVYGEEVVARVLTMQFYGEGSEKIGCTSTLRNPQGELKWEFDFAVSNDDSHNVWISERTRTDSLTIKQSLGSNSFSERYTINGTCQTFDFRTSDISRIRLLHQQLSNIEVGMAAKLSEPLPPLDQEILNTLVEFDEFYGSGNALHDNADGILVAELLTSTSVATWMEDRFPSDLEPEGSLDRWDKLCDAAAICAALKCATSLCTNPLCEVCGAIVLTCAIMDFFGLW